MKQGQPKLLYGTSEVSLSFFNPGRSLVLPYLKDFSSFKKKRVKVLDLGCGVGSKADFIRSNYPDFTFYGCDISKKMIAQAKKRFPHIKFKESHPEMLPYPNSFFDVVIANSVLDHSRNPEKLVSEAHRVLKKGGLFLTATPIEKDKSTLHGLFAGYSWYRNHRRKYCEHLHQFNKVDLRQMFSVSGFRLVGEDYIWFYFSQFLDLIFYPILALFGRPPGTSFSRFAESKNKYSIFRVVRNGISFIQNIEATVFAHLPVGFFMYVKAVKK